MSEWSREVKMPQSCAAGVCPFTSGDGACNLLVWMVGRVPNHGKPSVLCPEDRAVKGRPAPKVCPLRDGAVAVRLEDT